MTTRVQQHHNDPSADGSHRGRRYSLLNSSNSSNNNVNKKGTESDRSTKGAGAADVAVVTAPPPPGANPQRHHHTSSSNTTAAGKAGRHADSRRWESGDAASVGILDEAPTPVTFAWNSTVATHMALGGSRGLDDLYDSYEPHQRPHMSRKKPVEPFLKLFSSSRKTPKEKREEPEKRVAAVLARAEAPHDTATTNDDSDVRKKLSREQQQSNSQRETSQGSTRGGGARGASATRASRPPPLHLPSPAVFTLPAERDGPRSDPSRSATMAGAAEPSSPQTAHDGDAWVHAPVDCEYYVDMKRRKSAGQLLNTPYERLLRECVATVLSQRIAFDAPQPFEATARSRVLYLAWREHRSDGDDIALANNRNNADPFQGLVQHRCSLVWRLQKLQDINRYVRVAFEEEQRSRTTLEKSLLFNAAGGTRRSNSCHDDDRRSRTDAKGSASGTKGGVGLTRSGSSRLTSSFSSPVLTNTQAQAQAHAQVDAPSRFGGDDPVAAAARATVNFWLLSTNLCRIFDDLYCDTVALAAALPLFLPEGLSFYYTKKATHRRGPGGSNDSSSLSLSASVSASSSPAGPHMITSTPPACELLAGRSHLNSPAPLYRDHLRQRARLHFQYSEPKAVWEAEKRHVEETLADLEECWRAHQRLCEEMRLFGTAFRRRQRAGEARAAGNGGGGDKRRCAAIASAEALSDESSKALTTLGMLELAGLTDLPAFLLATVHTTDNALAAAAALHSLTTVTPPPPPPPAATGTATSAAEAETENKEQQRRATTVGAAPAVKDSTDDEGELLTARSYTSSDAYDCSPATPSRPFTDLSSTGHSGARSGSTPHLDGFASEPTSLNASGNFGRGGGRRSRSGSMKKVTMVVGSPMLVTVTGDDGDDDDEKSGPASPQPQQQPPHRHASSLRKHRPHRREKHVTFALDPIIVEAAEPTHYGDTASSATRRHGTHFCRPLGLQGPPSASTTATTTTTTTTAGTMDLPGGGESPSAGVGGGAVLRGRQSEFVWKRYYDECNEATATLLLLQEPQAQPEEGLLGEEASAQQRQRVHRLRVQNLLRLYFNLAVEDGAQRRQDCLEIYQEGREALTERVRAVEREIAELKRRSRSATLSRFGADGLLGEFFTATPLSRGRAGSDPRTPVAATAVPRDAALESRKNARGVETPLGVSLSVASSRETGATNSAATAPLPSSSNNNNNKSSTDCSDSRTPDEQVGGVHRSGSKLSSTSAGKRGKAKKRPHGAGGSNHEYCPVM